MDTDVLKYFSSMGVGGVIAGLIFLVYRKDAQQWQAAWKGQTELLMDVVKENTAAVTALITKLEERREQYGGSRRERHP